MYVEVKTNKKWKRSTNGWLAGVCEGIANSFDLNPNIVRAIWLLFVLAFGTGVLAYLILALVLPKEDELMEYHQDKILGVCKRIAEQTGVELALVRVLAVVSAFGSFGLTFVAYVVAHFTLPTAKKIRM